jgi:hypothetical protein
MEVSSYIIDKGSKLLSHPWVKKVGQAIGAGFGICVFLAFAAMFFEDRFPFLHPFIFWTVRIWAGMFIGTIAVVVTVFMVIGPGVIVSKELFENLSDSEDPPWIHRLVLIWCSTAGVLLSTLLGAAFALLATGFIKEVKVWFVGVCWMLLMIPWALIGMIGRKLIHRTRTRNSQNLNPNQNDSPEA